jgi:hypothetical protein
MQNTVIRFKNWDLVAWIGAQPGDALVAVRPIVEAIGLDLTTQMKKLAADESFSHRHMPTTGSDGKQYEMLCIPVRQVARWLCGVNRRKVKPELVEKLAQFQDDCAWTLHDAISGKVTPEVVARLEATVTALAETVKVLQVELAYERSARKELQSQMDWMQYRDDMEASHDGRRLRSRRKDIKPPLRAISGGMA